MKTKKPSTAVEKRKRRHDKNIQRSGIYRQAQENAQKARVELEAVITLRNEEIKKLKEERDGYKDRIDAALAAGQTV